MVGRPLTPALEREALRLYERYAVEVIEAYNLCPWASRARRTGEVATEVVGASSLKDASIVIPRLEALGARTPIAVALLIFPCWEGDRTEWERAVGGLRQAYDDSRPREARHFALAAFHPEAPADTTSPERLVPFIRRSPDPTIQLVRHSVLERVKRGNEGTAFVDPTRLVEMMASGSLGALNQPSTSERVARANLTTIEREGVAQLETVFAAIAEDRAQTYAALDAASGLAREAG